MVVESDDLHQADKASRGAEYVTRSLLSTSVNKQDR